MPGYRKKDLLDGNGNLVRPKYLSNHTHYSPTDPDAHHVIVAAMADYADKRDSQALSQIAEQTRQNLARHQMELGQIMADGAYSSGEALPYIEDNHINAWIPKRMSKIRSATVEPVLGTLINYLGLKKANTRGISGANKHCLLLAHCYNLKKLIKFNPVNRKTRANIIKMIIETENFSFLNRFYWYFAL